MEYIVEGSLEWSALCAADLPQLAELRTTIEYFDDPVERQDLAQLQEYWTAPGADPVFNCTVGRDKGGTIVAYGWNHVRGLDVGEPRVWLDGGVHPAWRHQHIGRRLMEWQVERARLWYAKVLREQPWLQAPLWLGTYVDQKLEGQSALCETLGLAPERWYFDMHLTFGMDQPGPVLPVIPLTGRVQLQHYHPALSEQVRLAHNEVFAASFGSHTVSVANWEHSMDRSAARPEWSWVATQDGEVVGYALNSAYEQDWGPQGFSEGWTDRLGVRPGWRGHNLGRALLLASMRSFLDAGLEGAGVGVDTARPDAALRLFESIGYQAEEMVVLHSTVVPPIAV
ncbi:GNAT family N-acetyltransferase [Luteococcus peritonei]|uniref:GNAT family N-acetyltransferase n=1 Tax=Luteococcus peritonei TaxID=88874 RepID=A0ABW4S167_9ACTN